MNKNHKSFQVFDNIKQLPLKSAAKIVITSVMVFTFLVNPIIKPIGVVNAQSGSSPSGTRTSHVFLPLIVVPVPRKVILGTYTDGYLGKQSTIDDEVKAIDTWSGKRLSLVGTFIAIEDQYPDYNIPVPLGLIWESGYTPFVNLNTGKTLMTINSGGLDDWIRNMALAFKTWRDQGLAKDENRRAFVAPLQEMNGDWVSYFGSPSDFKTAFARIQNIFNQVGAGPAVRWVFAPNGWSDPSDPPFEDYYPGDSSVEVIAFSGYNSGYCPSATWKEWDGPDVVFGPYIQRSRIMAPSKPIIIAQTATTAYDQSGINQQSKNSWLIDSYNYLANQAGVIGIIYYNKALNQSCDWPFYQSNGTKYDGYRVGVVNSTFIYLSPETLASKQFTP